MPGKRKPCKFAFTRLSKGDVYEKYYSIP